MIVYDTFVNIKLSTYSLDKRDEMPDHLSNSIVSVLTSIVAAIIFWLAFNYIPHAYRKCKIKPIQENYLKQINSQITHFITYLMSPNPFAKELFQDLVVTGKLTKKQLEEGLSNKTIIPSDELPSQLRSFLMQAGEEIKDTQMNIDRLSERALRYPEALNLKTINLLEKLCNAVYEIPAKHYNPLAPNFIAKNPSIAVHKEKIYKVYCLNLELRREIFKQNKSSYDHLILECRYLISHGKFRKARKLLKKAIKSKNNDSKSEALDYIAISYIIEKGACKTTKRKIEHAIAGSNGACPALGRRKLLSHILNYPEYYSLLENKHLYDLPRVIKTLDNEERLQKEALGNAKKLELLNQIIPF